MPQDTPQNPVVLDPAQLVQRVDVLMRLIEKEGGCNRLTVAVAEKISDPRETGTARNVVNAMPQLMEVDPATGKQRRAAIDISDGTGKLGGDGQFQAHEYTVALMVGAKLAVELGVDISKVPIDQRFIDEANKMCPLVTNQACAIPSR